jgi:tetratricopeptide (TPR) repeat protein
MEWKEFDSPQKEIRRLVILLKKNPKDAAAWYDLATAYASLYDFGNAIECGTKAVELDDQSALYRAFLVYAFLRDGQDQSAVDSLVKLVELNPDESDYYIELVIDSLYAINEEVALMKIQQLRGAGRESVAHTIERWIWNP